MPIKLNRAIAKQLKCAAAQQLAAQQSILDVDKNCIIYSNRRKKMNKKRLIQKLQEELSRQEVKLKENIQELRNYKKESMRLFQKLLEHQLDMKIPNTIECPIRRFCSLTPCECVYATLSAGIFNWHLKDITLRDNNFSFLYVCPSENMPLQFRLSQSISSSVCARRSYFSVKELKELVQKETAKKKNEDG